MTRLAIGHQTIQAGEIVQTSWIEALDKVLSQLFLGLFVAVTIPEVGTNESGKGLNDVQVLSNQLDG